MKNLEMCPYCGSIETIGGVCRWCNNTINETYESEEQPMNVELRFTGLTPKLALRLIEVVNESGEQPGIDIPAAAPEMNIAPAAYQMPKAPTAGMMFTPAPTTAPQNMPAPTYQQMPAAVPAAPPVAPPTAPPVAPPPQYDVEMLGRAAAPLAAAGKRQELYNLLQSFGVQSINELPRERYGEMAIALRGLGAQI